MSTILCKGHRGEVTGLCALEGRSAWYESSSFLSCAEDATVKMWDMKASSADTRCVMTISNIPNGENATEIACLASLSDGGYLGAVIAEGHLTVFNTAKEGSIVGTVEHPNGGEEWCVFDQTTTVGGSATKIVASMGEYKFSRVFFVLDECGVVYPVHVNSKESENGPFTVELLGAKSTKKGDGITSSVAFPCPEHPEWRLSFPEVATGPKSFGAHENLGVGLVTLPPTLTTTDASASLHVDATPTFITSGMDAALKCYRFPAGGKPCVSNNRLSTAIEKGTVEMVHEVNIGGWGDNPAAAQIANPPIPTCMSSYFIPNQGSLGYLAVGRGDGSYMILSKPEEVEQQEGGKKQNLLEMELIAPGHECNGLIGVHFVFDPAVQQENGFMLCTVALSGEVTFWNMKAIIFGDESEGEITFAYSLRDEAKGNLKSPLAKATVNCSCLLNGGTHVILGDGYGRITVVPTNE